MFCLLELVAVAPDLLASRFISQLNWIKVCVKADKALPSYKMIKIKSK